MTKSQYDPGAAMYGNFCNYYSFYPSDERVQLIPFDLIFQNTGNYVCLDIGCNSGELTKALYNKIVRYDETKTTDGNCKILAVDIDPLLIERAKDANINQCIKFECVDVISNDFNGLCDLFLADHCRETFDIVFLFSVTMWIHLNNGDEGLRIFLKTISSRTKILLLEPQPWKCYKAAVRRRKRAKKKAFQFWNQLQIRESIEEDLARILCEECSFELVWKSERTIWGRKISLFKKKS